MRQANQEVVLRHHKEIWSEGRLESIPELLAHDFVAHHRGALDWLGLEDVRAVVQRTRVEFPDFHESVEDLMVDGERVITRLVARGTHLGTYQGLPADWKVVCHGRDRHLSHGRRQDRRKVGPRRPGWHVLPARHQPARAAQPALCTKSRCRSRLAIVNATHYVPPLKT